MICTEYVPCSVGQTVASNNALRSDFFEPRLTFHSYIKPETPTDSEQSYDDKELFDPFGLINYGDPEEIATIQYATAPAATRNLPATSSSPSVSAAAKHSLLLQQLQPDPQSDAESKRALARLLAQMGQQQTHQGQPVGVVAGHPQPTSAPAGLQPRQTTILEQELTRPDRPKQEANSATLQFLARAGIDEPGRRQIHLHSELVRHLSAASSTAPAAPVAAVAPQVKQSGAGSKAPAVQTRAGAGKADGRQAVVSAAQAARGGGAAQKIIIQKVQPQILQPVKQVIGANYVCMFML